MSLTITTDVFCDGTDEQGRECMEWEFGTTGPRTNATKARANAKGRGWTRVNGKDYCLRCTARRGSGEQTR